MKKPIQHLLQLQELEFADVRDSNSEAAISKLRQKIPLLILKNYDRLTDRGKKGVAAVHHQVCGGCHMRIPIGAIVALANSENFQMCENCGRYLYLPADEQKHLGEFPADPKAIEAISRPKHKAQARAM